MTTTRLALAMCVWSCLAWTAACDRSRPGQTRAVIVLGFDGLDYELTRTLMAAGRLPHLSRLAKEGGFSPLATTFPPQSPVAWSTFTTGLDSSGHGIFDFVHRDPATLEPYLSTTRADAPSWIVPFGRWQFPLRGGRVVSLRQGQPFWAALHAEAIPTTIMRMPANYPPSGQATHELSGMGTPDLLGTYGTFSFYTSDPFLAAGEVAGGSVTRVRVRDDRVDAFIDGPPNPLRRSGDRLTVPLTVYRDPVEPAARIVAGREERVLNVGEWSDWVTVEFELAPLQSLKGMCRFFLKQVRPNVEVYASPVNLDPLDPAQPISTPPGFAADLARTSGRFYTQGMPEDTKGLLAGVLRRDEFLQQARYTAAENLRQYEYLLGRFHRGLLFHYFGHVDQVSHMLWRARDPEHPAYDREQDSPYREVIDNLYADLDAIVGMTLERLPPDGLLIVMSDHGFASWRRTFHLNRWLEEHGYLAIRALDQRGAPMLTNIDWTRTRAYGLGLNGLYLNLKGRDRFGIVDPAEADRLTEEIANALGATIDPVTDHPVVTAIRRTSRSSLGHPERAPDLIVGYAPGTRNSSESAEGQVPGSMLSDNRTEWSGDHCMDPAGVPGVLFSNRPLAVRVTSLKDLAGAITGEFGRAQERASRR